MALAVSFREGHRVTAGKATKLHTTYYLANFEKIAYFVNFNATSRLFLVFLGGFPYNSSFRHIEDNSIGDHRMILLMISLMIRDAFKIHGYQ